MIGCLSCRAKRSLPQLGAQSGGPLRDVFARHDVDGGQRSDRRNRIATVGRNRQTAEGLGDLGRGDGRAIGMPEAMPLANVMMSGCTPKCSMPFQYVPVRPKPVWTSSQMNRAPALRTGSSTF